jgi:hypothetical protein
MANISIADGLYLLNKNLSKTATPIVTDVPTDHIVVIDCSGSMSYELPKIRQQLKNKLPMMMKEKDTVSIVWFSGKTQYGVVVENVPLHNAVDLTGVHRAIDNFLKPVGLTGFVEPLQEVAQLIGRVQQPGRAINLFFMSDGYDNQWKKEEILSAVDKLNPLVSSAAVVEYGWYCNRPLMVQMSERLGATEILAENFSQYEPTFETAMTKKIAGVKKVTVDVTTAIHGFAFAIHEGEVLTFAADNRQVSVPEGITDVYWFAEMPQSANFESAKTVYDPKYKEKEVVLQGLYASLIPLTQRMLSNDIFRVLKAIGDVRLIKQFSNCFGKQAYLEFQNAVAECVVDPSKRLTEGYNPDEVPAEDAFTIIDLLYELAGDEGNKFYPNHPAFNYERIGRKAVEADAELTDEEAKRVAEITMQLHMTRAPATIKRLMEEISAITDKKREGLKFVADNPDAGYPVSSLVFNEDRPNISAQVRISGTVDLLDLIDGLNSVTDPKLPMDFPVRFPTSIVRNYTIIRDGIRNVKVLPVSVTRHTFQVMCDNGIFGDADVVGSDWEDGKIYEIDLMKLPLINRKMVKSVSAKELFQRQYELTMEKANQKVFNHFFDEYFPPQATTGLAEKYGADAAAWLSSLGIKDYGYSPKVELVEATESYMGRELAVSVSGLSSLPSVKSVLDKMDAGKKLTARESALCSAIAEVRGFLDSAAYKSIGDKPKNDMLHVWLTNRKRDTIATCRKLMREIAQIKFSIIVGQTWFTEFESLDQNSLTMDFAGTMIECTANLREVEIKI